MMRLKRTKFQPILKRIAIFYQDLEIPTRNVRYWFLLNTILFLLLFIILDYWFYLEYPMFLLLRDSNESFNITGSIITGIFLGGVFWGLIYYFLVKNKSTITSKEISLFSLILMGAILNSIFGSLFYLSPSNTVEPILFLNVGSVESVLLIIALIPLGGFSFFIFLAPFLFLFWIYFQFLKKMKKTSPSKLLDIKKDIFISEKSYQWVFPDRITIIDCIQWLFLSYGSAALFAVPIAELRNFTSYSIEFFSFRFEIAGSFAVTLLLGFGTMFIYKDNYWKSTIPLIEKYSFSKKYNRIAFSKITIIAGMLNLLFVLSKYFGTNLHEAIGRLIFGTIFLILMFAFYFANFIVKLSCYRSEIEQNINSSNILRIDKSILDN